MPHPDFRLDVGGVVLFQTDVDRREGAWDSD
jgi:hypothetical protein